MINNTTDDRVPECVAPGIYSIRIPLPENPLKWLNAYAVRGNPGERNLLIDTGFRRPECLNALLEGMQALNFDPARTDVFLTHLHSDHTGNAGALQRSGCRVIMGAIDYEILTHETWDERCERMLREGMSVETLNTVQENNPARIYAPEPFSAVVVDGGSLLRYGDYVFRCIHTPGHTPGHICLYDAERKLIILGDHVIFDITPNISFWTERPDALGDYLESLRKIKELDVQIALPGHRTLGQVSFCERIETLLAHHEARLAECLQVIRAHPGSSAYTIAGNMTWRIHAKNWDEFPPGQKWFAVGETLSHLDHLLMRGMIRTEEDPLTGQRSYYPVENI